MSVWLPEVASIFTPGDWFIMGNSTSDYQHLVSQARHYPEKLCTPGSLEKALEHISKFKEKDTSLGVRWFQYRVRNTETGMIIIL